LDDASGGVGCLVVQCLWTGHVGQCLAAIRTKYVLVLEANVILSMEFTKLCATLLLGEVRTLPKTSKTIHMILNCEPCAPVSKRRSIGYNKIIINSTREHKLKICITTRRSQELLHRWTTAEYSLLPLTYLLVQLARCYIRQPSQFSILTSHYSIY
jgi:hypothetical protein